MKDPLDTRKERIETDMIAASEDRAEEQNARESAHWYKKYMNLREMAEQALADAKHWQALSDYIESTSYTPHIAPKQPQLFPPNEPK